MTPVLLYDADCGFCTRSAQWALRLGCAVEVVAWQAYDLASVGVTPEQATEQVYLVDGVHRWPGHVAVGQTLVRSRRLPVRLAGRVVLLPVLAPLASRVYRWVADHRYRLPGGTAACDPRQQPGRSSTE